METTDVNSLFEALKEWDAAPVAIFAITVGFLLLIKPLIEIIRVRSKVRAAKSIVVSIQNKDGSESTIELKKEDVSSEDLKKLISLVSPRNE